MDSSSLLDPVFVVVLILSVFVTLGLYLAIYRLSSTSSATDARQPQQPPPQLRENHPQGPQLQDAEEDDSSSDEEDAIPGQQAKPKLMGKKKRAKLERKQAMKEYRQYQLEQSKAKMADQKAWVKDLRKSEKEKAEVAAADEAEWQEYLRKKQEKEEEEYQQWKSSMQVEGSGSGESERDKLWNRKLEVAAAVVRERIVLLEALASRFHTTTALMVELLTEMVRQDSLEGIFDERGKFIHVTREDRLKIAKIINRRGRVSISELSREANAIISLEPLVQEPDLSAASSSTT